MGSNRRVNQRMWSLRFTLTCVLPVDSMGLQGFTREISRRCLDILGAASSAWTRMGLTLLVSLRCVLIHHLQNLDFNDIIL